VIRLIKEKIYGYAGDCHPSTVFRKRSGKKPVVPNNTQYDYYEISKLGRRFVFMGREKDRKLRRRKGRRAKLHKLKAKLAQTKDLKDRQRLIEKIRKISVYPNMEIPRD
jgi:hypothetical protein